MAFKYRDTHLLQKSTNMKKHLFARVYEFDRTRNKRQFQNDILSNYIFAFNNSSNIFYW